MLFRPKERAWDREECLSEERQDERAARGRGKLSGLWCQGRKEENSGHRTGWAQGRHYPIPLPGSGRTSR